MGCCSATRYTPSINGSDSLLFLRSICKQLLTPQPQNLTDNCPLLLFFFQALKRREAETAHAYGSDERKAGQPVLGAWTERRAGQYSRHRPKGGQASTLEPKGGQASTLGTDRKEGRPILSA